MIEVTKISKAFDGKTVLKDLEFSASNSETIGIVAPNGSGKSVILETIIGRIIPDKGLVKISKDARSHIYYMPQKDNYPDNMLVSEVIDFYLEANKKKVNSEQREYYIKRYGLKKLVSNKVSALSGGQQRKLGIVLTMLLKPRIAVLDEPSAGIDLKSTLLFREDVKSLTSTLVLLTSHTTEDLLSTADRLIFLQHGQVIYKLARKDFSHFSELYADLFTNASTEVSNYA
ncbi:MAG: ABC transporter ATP-binding protein [Oenococcus oeni]